MARLFSSLKKKHYNVLKQDRQMPGIYGYIKKTPGESSQLISMTEAMKLYNHFVQDEQYEDNSVAASRVHLGHIGEKSSPYHNGGVRLWVEGEAYNCKEVAKRLRLKQKGVAASLVEAYQTDKLDNYLNLLDGYFCAAIYDAKKKKVLLVSDRYGMRMLYWYCCGKQFVWSSEVKGILALNGIDTTLDPASPQCFLDLGYLMGENTWFQHIKLIKPATVLECDIASQKIEQHRYWKWSEIKPSNLSFDGAVAELGQRFINAVRRRFDPNKKIGISLSGGLDSRAMLAAVDQLYPEYQGYSYTFGIAGCDDIRIAQKVVSLTNWRHQIFELHQGTWFQPRLERIWLTDGMLDLMHMHGCEFLDDISQHININLNGFLGDAILGGSYLEKTKEKDKRITLEIARKYYGRNVSGRSVKDAFYDVPHIEPLLYMSRGRRFINMGTVNALVKVDQRKPFFDNTIIEFVFALPDEYRLDSKLYSAMLIKFFPKFFNDIPWQKTGCPLAYSNALTKTITFKNRIVDRLKREVGRIGIKYKDLHNYTDYAEWLRQEPAKSFFETTLFSKRAIYPEYIDQETVQNYFKHHLQNKANHHDELCRTLTFELWLQQVFLGRYRHELF
jgi:asparagine synthase (glutamine-hydrolysing)